MTGGALAFKTSAHVAAPRPLAHTGLRPLLKALSYRLEYIAFRLVGFVFGALPVEWASALSGSIWQALAPLLPRQRRTLDNLRMAFPEKSEAERRAIASAMWNNLGRTFAEFFHLDEIVASRIDVAMQGAAEAVAEHGGKLVFCAPHIGNWEITIVSALSQGLNPTAVYQRLKNPLVDAFVLSVRSHLYPGGLFPKDISTPRRLMRHARSGETVAFLADQREKRGTPVPFFGRPAPSTPFPATMAIMFGRPVMCVYAERLPGVRFRIHGERLDIITTGAREADIVMVTAAIQAAFERFVRAHPGQWMWSHRRW